MFTLYVDNEIELRLHDETRVDEFYHLIDRNRAHLHRFLEWEEYHQSPEDTRRYILSERKSFAEAQNISTVIHYQGKLAGSLNLMIHDWSWGHGEIGYWLGEEFTGKGIITHAAKVLLDYAFNTLRLHKVIIRAIKENETSWKVAERLGFQHEGFQIQQRLLYGNYYDYTIYYMLRADWPHSNAPEFAWRIDDKIELRPFIAHHAAPYFALIDKHRTFLREWLDWVDKTQTIEDIDAFIARSMETYGEYNGLRLGIWYEGQPAGQVGYNFWDLRSKKGEIGYWLAPTHTGKGIMTKSVAALIDYGFRVVGLHRAEILMGVGNDPSEAVARRLGASFEGILRSGEVVNGKLIDNKLYAILSDEWKMP
jgi:ribosomal-protein-serine acetyltransferase